ncbi:hypothetical protein Aperf_G00000063604 [Anoplocephala perfoliata]
MSDCADVLRQFLQGLDGLKENDKNKINKLTFLARDHADIPGFPRRVVDATVRHVYEIPASYKLLGLYVIDSIVKNVDVPYRKLYTDEIVPLFVNSFQMIREEATRKRLFNLRTTWKDIFPYSKMRILDNKVRELDPAWPVIPKDDGPSENRIPSVPKLPSAKIANDKPLASTSQLLNPVTESVISESRDPRLCKKRKSPPSESSTGQFLIDRDGNRKMELIARKLGRFEEEAERQVSKKPKTLFCVKDQDMRSAPTSALPSRSLDSDKPYRPDIDMRLGGAAQPSVSSFPRVGFDIRPADRPLPVSRSSTVDPLHQSHPTPYECHSRLNTPTQPAMHPHPAVHGPPGPPHFPMMGHQDLTSLPPSASSGYNRPHRGPQINGPDWSVEIDGLNDMIQIGIDPRMLVRAANPKAERKITIDGLPYRLLLDRIQPLIQYGDNLYAVRFRCESLAFIIDRQRVVVPGTGFTKVWLLGRERLVYLGGPGHELVIDGRPHTIPFSTQYSTINIDNQTVPVMYDCEFPHGLNVLPPIPRQILDWAYRGLFGSPSNLHLAPRNPLVELEKQMENRSGDASGSRNRQQQIMHRPIPPEEYSNPIKNNASNSEALSDSQGAPAGSVNVDELLSKLVAAGVFNKPEVLPNIKEYDWEKFRRPYMPEIEALYSGFQCLQCGLRFESETAPAFIAHLDYHYMKNSTENQGRRSRNYYQPANNWLTSGLVEDTDKPAIKETSVKKCYTFADEKLNECVVCGDKFDKVFDRQEGQWLLQGAELHDGKAYHPICWEDAGKQLPIDVGIKPEKIEEGSTEEQTGSVSPAQLLSVSINSEPEIIESKVGIDTLNFSSSHNPDDEKAADTSGPRASPNVSPLDFPVGGESKGEPTKPSPTLPPSSSLGSFLSSDNEVVNLGIARNSLEVAIPGLSPTTSVDGSNGILEGCFNCDELDEEGRTGIVEDGGGDGRGAGDGEPLVTPAAISSDPLGVLEAVLRRKVVLP